MDGDVRFTLQICEDGEKGAKVQMEGDLPKEVVIEVLGYVLSDLRSGRDLSVS